MNPPRSRGILDPMTELARARPHGGRDASDAVVSAEAAAAAAALAGGVEIVTLEAMPDLDAVQELFAQIWNAGDEPPVSGELMRALAHAGNYVAGAYDSTRGNNLAGACVGFFGPPADRTLHSHIAGVTPAARGRSVGYALKLHQHAWALRQGVRAITWTFDPLVSRNAYLNIAKLGATPVVYLPNFYGEMADGINAGQGSDRLLVSWAVRPEVELTRRDGEAAGARVLLEQSDDGRPSPLGGRPPRQGETSLVRVPRDIEQLRREQPAVARSWRAAVGDVLGGLLADGGRVTGFTRRGYYVVEGTAS